MKIAALFIVVGLVGSLFALPARSQETPDAAATIAALQTRVAELEEELGITPTPKPANGAGVSANQQTISGTALDLVPAGADGEVSIVLRGAYNPSGGIPVIIRNNTDAPIQNVSISATAYDASGVLTGAGENLLAISPYYLMPGEISMGTVSFEGIEFAPGTEFRFVIESDPGEGERSFGLVDFVAIEVSAIEDRFVGQATNASNKNVFSVNAYFMCFDEAGALLSFDWNEVDASGADAGQTVPFQKVLHPGERCTRFLVSVGGYA